jgi:GTP cyclohydrolase IA
VNRPTLHIAAEGSRPLRGLSEPPSLPPEARLAECFRAILAWVDPEPFRAGTADTPRRAAAALWELTRGYEENPYEILATFAAENYDEMVVVRDVPFYSLCEHHLLPFHGKAHVGYVPDGRIVGLSKIPRVVNAYARRLQVQERLTDQIASCLEEVLQPRGVIVVVEAEHLCMSMRGVQTPGATTITSALRGVLLTKPEARAEALEFFRG